MWLTGVCVCVLALAQVENTLKRYCNDLHAVIQYITEPKQLKEAVKALYQKHVLEPPQVSILISPLRALLSARPSPAYVRY